MKSPQYWLLGLSGLSNGSLRKLLLSLLTEDTAFLHLLGYQVTSVHGWWSPRCDRCLLAEAAERDLLISKAMEIPLSPGAGLEEATTLLVLILGCLGSTFVHKDQKILRK